MLGGLGAAGSAECAVGEEEGGWKGGRAARGTSSAVGAGDRRCTAGVAGAVLR